MSLSVQTAKKRTDHIMYIQIPSRPGLLDCAIYGHGLLFKAAGSQKIGSGDYEPGAWEGWESG